MPDTSTTTDFMHRGARKIAQRCFGAASPENVAVVYRWMRDPARRPPFLCRDGKTIIAWESQIHAHALKSAEPANVPDDPHPAAPANTSSGHRISPPL